MLTRITKGKVYIKKKKLFIVWSKTYKCYGRRRTELRPVNEDIDLASISHLPSISESMFVDEDDAELIKEM